ncbi:Aquaporin protein [Vigna angularis]|uniref:Aquaporin protein n=1 Tax=Phaseolus angularis TaxID=3914 RepID=A0A8T0KUG0_PHAAN|nr:Aquaporin protein [Vigna angularis]
MKGAICRAAVVKGFQLNQFERLGGGANTLSKRYSKGDLGAEILIIVTSSLMKDMINKTDLKQIVLLRMFLRLCFSNHAFSQI